LGKGGDVGMAAGSNGLTAGQAPKGDGGRGRFGGKGGTLGFGGK